MRLASFAVPALDDPSRVSGVGDQPDRGDLAVQGSLVLSQQEIYALRPEARSRLNTVFVGGAVGSALSGVLYEHAGWSGVAILGIVFALIGFGIWSASQLLRRVKRLRDEEVVGGIR